jgi:3-phosphoshikimate 1-carboxyvinyltransferase
MPDLLVHPVSALQAEFSVPGDKSLSHRAAIFSGVAHGQSVIRNFLPSADCLCTLAAMQALGAQVEVIEEMPGCGPVAMRIRGTAMQLCAPQTSIDCGNSGTAMRLLAGLLAGQPFESQLHGDASLSTRPMGRVIEPLRAMGAQIDALGETSGCAPLRILPATLKGMTHRMSVASAQVKSALLLAGLFASGETTVIQPATTRDHTERLLGMFGVDVRIEGDRISIDGGSVPVACDFTVPGDLSSAAFWFVAAATKPGSCVTIRDVGLNPTRTAILDVLQRMGARVEINPARRDDEPVGDVVIKGVPLHGTEVLKHEIPNLIDEIPVIAVAAALAEGRTTIRHAAELRVKESDRIRTVAANLRAMGCLVDEFDDGMEITGGRMLQGAEIPSFGDHRIAMAFAIAGLSADGPTRILDTACVGTSYPGFARHLDAVLCGSSDPVDFQLTTTSAA